MRVAHCCHEHADQTSISLSSLQTARLVVGRTPHPWTQLRVSSDSRTFYVGTPRRTLRESGVSRMPCPMRIPGPGPGSYDTPSLTS
jgi:hypothetical protein